MTHMRFWDIISPGLWAGTGRKPNGGLISSELLIECIPDAGEDEETWKQIAATVKHSYLGCDKFKEKEERRKRERE